VYGFGRMLDLASVSEFDLGLRDDVEAPIMVRGDVERVLEVESLIPPN
jgi:hypothetical protein